MSTLEGVPVTKYNAVHYTRGVGIELARGPIKAFPHMVGLRERPETVGDYLVDAFDDLPIKDGALDFVFVWGVEQNAAIRAEVLRCLKVGGNLVEAHEDCIVIEIKAAGGWEEAFKRIPAARPQKSVCVVRHGAIGDTLQAASILPELKRQGYHVTWMSEPLGEELMRHDPHVDAFLIQDKDQVPNGELQAYWAQMAKGFDKFINLSESVEGTLIALPGRPNYHWPKSVRDKRMGENYLEFTAALAELPLHPEHKFYATEAEFERAAATLADIYAAVNAGWTMGMKAKQPFVIMWALSGSAMHKLYPHQDAVIARILTEIPHAHIILVGDPTRRLLEQGWEDEQRIHRTCGELSIRVTLALAQRCDLVIGPETGVLNAVAFEPMAKVMLLSHSSIENLTKHWVNTISLAADHLPCFPCHRLHYTREFCPQHEESMTSLCMAELNPATVWDAVWASYVGWATVKKLLEV